MTFNAKASCSLNATECILETIASILSEVHEQNNEYNWDPLTFVFTAIIGAIAILFAALTALQASLAAGPGRTKSGVYAIGPWSQRNHRRFDVAEMRFRTTSFTPVLTIDSLNFDILSREGSFSSYQDPARLRKRKDDYFPATWLALLTHLSLDSTKLWDEVKLTGADFIPLELSAVPAYGSIRFVVFLAMILSQGCGRLTIDRESGLPRVRDRRFNLIFRQHPLLGAIGFFEMYGEISFEEASRHIRMRLLQAHGHMNISELVHGDKIKSFLNTGRVLVFNHFLGDDFISSFTANVERQCPHCNQNPKPPCLNMLEYLKSLNGGFFTFLKVYHTGFLRNGPLYLLMAPTPKSDLLPFFFPHKKAKLRERLDTLLLQNRFWGTKRTVYRVLSSTSPADNAHMGLERTNTAVSWAKLNIKPDVDDLVFSERAYNLCSAYLEQSPTQNSGYDEESMEKQRTLQRELVTIDHWLKKIETYVLCRVLTLSVLGDGIQQMIDRVQQQPILKAPFGIKSATVPSNLDGILLPTLHEKLGHLLEAISKPNGFNHLYTEAPMGIVYSPEAIRQDTSEGLRNIKNLWELEELPITDDVSGNGNGVGGDNEHKSRALKFLSAIQHPLDNVLIYRAVLMAMLYCLSSDSSDLMDEDAYRTIVPIM